LILLRERKWATIVGGLVEGEEPDQATQGGQVWQDWLRQGLALVGFVWVYFPEAIHVAKVNL
jgi:hypothetical protein